MITVSKFLYFFFFLDRATNGLNATVTHLSTNATTVFLCISSLKFSAF